jgi:hypothetical protein
MWATSVVLIAAALVGCATGPRNPAAAQAGASAQRILLLPLNVAVTLPAELESGSDRVWNAVSGYVGEHGKQVQTIGFGAARRLWFDVIRQIEAGERKGGASFETAAKMLVTALGREAEFDAVIMPSLFIQEARVSGKHARWDGVARRVEIDGDVRRIGSIMTATSLVGSTPGASLHVAILDAGGEKLHEAQAGLELLLRMGVEGAEGAPARELGIVWEPRPDLFESQADVREGIVKALDPFLPPIDEPR